MKIKTNNDIKKEIKLLMEYAVPSEHMQPAALFVDKHAGDRIALNLFHCFYSFLPEACDDAITELRLLDHKDGAFLLCATTIISDYLYLATVERAEFAGSLSEGDLDEEVVTFFGCADQTAFRKKYNKLSEFPVYTPNTGNKDLCVFCSVTNSEYHVFGCPAEICPWCGGQVTNCNCRFSQLGANSMANEAHIDAFLKLITKKGRIPFDAENQKPSFPDIDDVLE